MCKFIGDQIRKKRMDLKLYQRDLAEILGVNVQTVTTGLSGSGRAGDDKAIPVTDTAGSGGPFLDRVEVRSQPGSKQRFGSQNQRCKVKDGLFFESFFRNINMSARSNPRDKNPQRQK